MSTHHYSSSSSSQIFSTNTPSSSTLTNSNAKPFLPSSLSINKPTFSSMEISNTTSPTSAKLVDTSESMRKHGETSSSHLFASPNSFFSNGHKGKTIQYESDERKRTFSLLRFRAKQTIDNENYLQPIVNLLHLLPHLHHLQSMMH